MRHAPVLHKSYFFTCAFVLQVQEECGFEVAPDKLQWVTQYVGAVGTSGARHDMFYAEVDESMRVSKGGGLE